MRTELPYWVYALGLYGLVGLFGVVSYALRRWHYYFFHSWLSTKLWLALTPVLLGVLGYAGSWVPWLLALVSIFALKTYFQIFGVYHQQGLVWGAYGLVVLMAWTLKQGYWLAFSAVPLAYWLVGAFWLISRRSFRKSLQFITLAAMGVVLLGWGLFHLGWIYQQPEGLWYVLWAIGFTELAENTQLSLGFGFGRYKPFVGIDRRRSLEGLLVAYGLSMSLSWVLSQLLPAQGLKRWWWLLTTECFFLSLLGGLMMTAFRKDAGIFRYSPFIANRADFLSRVERLIFVAPAYYWTLKGLMGVA